MSIGLPPLSSGSLGTGTLAPTPSPAAGQGASASAAQGAGTVRDVAGASQTNAAAPVRENLPPTPAQAVAAAKLEAAARPGGLAPLLADLPQAVGNQDLPAPVRDTANQILSLNLPVDKAPTGADIRQAFAATGPTTESRFAVQAGVQTGQNSGQPVGGGAGQGAANSAPAQSPNTPASNAPPTVDLKSLLLVLRQTLSDFVAQQGEASSVQTTLQTPALQTAAAAAVPASVASETAAQPANQPAAQTAGPAPQAGTPAPAAPVETPAAPDLAPSQTVQAASVLAQAVLPNIATAAAQNPAAFSTLALLQAMGFVKTSSASGTDSVLDTDAPASQAASAVDDTGEAPAASQRLPVKGGATSAQSPAKATLASGGDVGSIARHLLDDSQTALAHQKLLQIASLPETSKQATPQNSHWMFEIPLSTPQGTAVAQFAIDKDGGDETDEQSGPTIWRARFSVSLEPLGPVHAQIALGGEKTFVTLWADRRASLQALKDDAGSLAETLNAAELNAEIAFRPVLTPNPIVLGSGHFLDRLS